MICNLASVGILRCTYSQRVLRSSRCARRRRRTRDGAGERTHTFHTSHARTPARQDARSGAQETSRVAHASSVTSHSALHTTELAKAEPQAPRSRKGSPNATLRSCAAIWPRAHRTHTHTHDTKLRESGNTKQGPCSSKRLARPPARLFANHFRTASPPPQFHRPRPACIHPPPSAPLDMPACRPPRRASRFGRALRPPIFQPHALAPHSSPHHRACYGLRQASHDASHSIIRQLATGRPTLLDHSSTRHAALCRCAGHTGHTAQQPAKIWAKLRSSIASSVVLKTLIGVVCGLPRAARYLVAVSIAARRSRSEAP